MQLQISKQVKGSNPPSVTLGTNCGSGIAAQVNVSGDDTFGIITVNTGDNPYGQKICQVAFTQSHLTDNLIIELRPYNRQAIGLKVAAEAIEGSGFQINSSDELNDNDVYQFVYEVIEIL